MTLAIWSFAGLMSLVIISYISGLLFHIRSNRFYNYFHLTAGALAVFLFYSFTGNYVYSIILTEALGIAWEIYEWNLWKYVLKKKRFQPQLDDTRNDLVVDFIGSLFGVVALALWIGK